MAICPMCGAFVTNLKRHIRRKRCDKHQSVSELRRRRQ